MKEVLTVVCLDDVFNSKGNNEDLSERQSQGGQQHQ